MLPAALACILSWPPASAAGAAPVEGEDRLLHALTGLVVTPLPRIEPAVLIRCLDAAVAAARDSDDNSDGADGLARITGSHMRMKLLHSILSVGNNVCCADSSPAIKEGWKEKETMFMEILAAQPRKQ